MGRMFDTGHIAQLHEIQRARLRRGEPGIGEEVEELIRRLTSGGVASVSDDLRIVRAKRLFDLGVGRELNLTRFENYLATIPGVPEALLREDRHFPHLILVEPRIGLTNLCALGNFVFSGDDKTFVPWNEAYANPTSPVWIRMRDGRKNRNRNPSACRTSFYLDEFGLTALEGVCSYLEVPSVVEEMEDNPNAFAMVLLGSVLGTDRKEMASLFVKSGQPMMYWHWEDGASPEWGSASKKVVLKAAA